MTDLQKFQDMICRLRPKFSDDTIRNIVDQTLRGSVKRHIDTLLLQNTTTFVPQKVADLLRNHERTAVVTSVELPQTLRQFPGADIIVRGDDAMMIKQILDFKPSYVVLNNCFFCRSDPLLPLVLETATNHSISLLIIMQIGSVNRSLLEQSSCVWLPSHTRLPHSIKEITEWKIQEYEYV